MVILVAVSEYTTIPVKQSTKKLLEKEKGDASWDEFLLLLLRIKRLLEMKEALGRIKKRLSKSEKFITESTEDLRRGLKLRELS